MKKKQSFRKYKVGQMLFTPLLKCEEGGIYMAVNTVNAYEIKLEDLLKMGAEPIPQDTPECDCSNYYHQVCDVCQGVFGGEKDTLELEQIEELETVEVKDQIMDVVNALIKNQKIIIKHLEVKGG